MKINMNNFKLQKFMKYYEIFRLKKNTGFSSVAKILRNNKNIIFEKRKRFIIWKLK